MDGFCLQGKLDLTLFYKIEGYFDNLKSLMTLMTVTLMTGLFGELKMIMTENDRDRKRPEFPVEQKSTAHLNTRRAVFFVSIEKAGHFRSRSFSVIFNPQKGPVIKVIKYFGVFRKSLNA